MRNILLSSLACAALAFPASALAQEKATRSVDDYLCTFAGKCGDDTGEEATKAAPETKGFSLARPGAAKTATPAKAAAPAARQSASTTVKAVPAARPTARGQKSAAVKATVAPRKERAEKRTAADQRRADLRLTFQLGSADLTPQAMEEAKVFAESMKRPELASMRFLIEGHTDSQGGRAYNMDLSQRRAQAVADYLASLGVARERLEVRGYGFDRPLDGRSAAAEENRRVEAVLTS